MKRKYVGPDDISVELFKIMNDDSSKTVESDLFR